MELPDATEPGASEEQVSQCEVKVKEEKEDEFVLGTVSTIVTPTRTEGKRVRKASKKFGGDFVTGI